MFVMCDFVMCDCVQWWRCDRSDRAEESSSCLYVSKSGLRDGALPEVTDAITIAWRTELHKLPLSPPSPPPPPPPLSPYLHRLQAGILPDPVRRKCNRYILIVSVSSVGRPSML